MTPRVMYLEIVIDGDTGTMDIEVINGDGKSCHDLSDPFFALGETIDRHEKPEAQTRASAQRRATTA